MSKVQLVKAVKKADEEAVRNCLQKLNPADKHQVLNNLTKKGESLLHTALQVSSEDVVRALLEQAELDIDIYDGEYGYTPLIGALAFSAPTGVIRALLSRNPDVTLRDKTDAANSAFHWAAALNATASLKILLDAKKAMRDIPNGKGETALLVAIKGGQEEAAVLLLQAGADVNFKDAQGKTALHEAVAGKLPNLAAAICTSADLDIGNCQDLEGNTPLHLACQTNQMRLAQILREAGFSDDTENLEGRKPTDYEDGSANPAVRQTEQNKEAAEARINKQLRKRQRRKDEMETTEVTRFLRDYGCDEAAVEILFNKRFHQPDEDLWNLNLSKLLNLGLNRESAELVTKALEKVRLEEEAREKAREELVLRERKKKQLSSLLKFAGIAAVVVAIVVLVNLLWLKK